MSRYHYTKVLAEKKRLAEQGSINPNGVLKIGAKSGVTDYLENSALVMAEQMNTIHQIASASHDDLQSALGAICDICAGSE